MKNSTAFILILVAIGLFYTFTMPQYDKVKALRSSADEYKGVIDNVTKLIETRDLLIDKYREIPKTEISKLDKILPDNVDTVRLALDLENLAAKHGIVIKSVRVVSPGDSGSSTVIQPSSHSYDSALVSVELVGTYLGFRDFIKDVEASDRITNVKELSFQSEDDGLYEYRATLETYWVK